MYAAFVLFVMTPLLGAALGSFYAAQIMRGEKFTKASGPFSVDDTTGERLKWFELIPIFSFIMLRGRSRYTKERLDPRMFISEILGFTSFLLLAVGSFIRISEYSGSLVEFILNYLVYFVVLCVFFYLAVYDLYTFSIPARETLYLTLGVVAFNLFIGLAKFLFPEFAPDTAFGTADNLLAGLIGGLVILFLILITRQKGMGQGDVYIAVIMGVMLGGLRGIASFYVTILLATAVGLILMLINGKLKGLIVPLVPFMLLGFATAIGLGESIVGLLFFNF